MGEAPSENWQQWALRQVRTEPKKAAMLTALVLIMGLLWARIFVFGVRSTAPADARTPGSVAAADADANAESSMPVYHRALLEWKKKPIPSVRQNIFQIKMEYFPRVGTAAEASAGPGAGDGFWDQVGKSLASKADQEKARQILIQNLRSQASKLDLKSTFMSDGKPKALINNALVGESDTVNGFRIVKIESTRIIVEREGVKLEVMFNFGQ